MIQRLCCYLSDILTMIQPTPLIWYALDQWVPNTLTEQHLSKPGTDKNLMSSEQEPHSQLFKNILSTGSAALKKKIITFCKKGFWLAVVETRSFWSDFSVCMPLHKSMVLFLRRSYSLRMTAKKQHCQTKLYIDKLQIPPHTQTGRQRRACWGVPALAGSSGTPSTRIDHLEAWSELEWYLPSEPEGKK